MSVLIYIVCHVVPIMQDDSGNAKHSRDAARSLYNRGTAYARLCNFKLAIECFDKILELEPDNSNAWYRRGVMFVRLCDYDEAIKSYDRALRIKPNHAAALNSRGVALLMMEQYEAAEAHFAGVLDDVSERLMTPASRAGAGKQWASMWCNRGYALEQLGLLEDALGCYGRALELDPGYALAWSNMGVIHEKLKEHSKAMKCFNEALRINPDYPGALYNRACLLAVTGDLEGALESLKRAVALSDDYRDRARDDRHFHSLQQDDRFNILTAR